MLRHRGVFCCALSTDFYPEGRFAGYNKATLGQRNSSKGALNGPCDENLGRIRQVGHVRWKEESGYHRRSLAETTMFRSKTIFGDKLSAHLYLVDKQMAPSIPEHWTNEDVAVRAKVADYLIIMCPVRNMIVPVTVEVHEIEPSEDLSRWDHVVKCSIELPSGQVLVDECTGDAVARVQVGPGCYQARLLYGGLDTLSPDGFEGNDCYKITLWPGPS